MGFRHIFVHFLTKDQSRLLVVNNDDSLGLTADGESLTSMAQMVAGVKTGWLSGGLFHIRKRKPS